MKCVKKDETIKRVSNSEARALVENQGYLYCSKKIWKEKVRDANK